MLFFSKWEEKKLGAGSVFIWRIRWGSAFIIVKPYVPPVALVLSDMDHWAEKRAHSHSHKRATNLITPLPVFVLRCYCVLYVDSQNTVVIWVTGQHKPLCTCAHTKRWKASDIKGLYRTARPLSFHLIKNTRSPFCFWSINYKLGPDYFYEEKKGNCIFKRDGLA